jgi:Pseudouridylate synthase
MLTLEYDGTNYSGWQIQDNANSIQAEVEKAIYRLTKKRGHLNRGRKNRCKSSCSWTGG